MFYGYFCESVVLIINVPRSFRVVGFYEVIVPPGIICGKWWFCCKINVGDTEVVGDSDFFLGGDLSCFWSAHAWCRLITWVTVHLSVVHR
jgi:hypothetical protein